MARSYQNLPVPVKRRHAGNQSAPATEDVFTRQTRRDYRVFIVVGMFLFATLLLFLQFVVVPWWQSVTDQWQYGNSKISTREVVVGHADSRAHPTTILSFDLNARVEIIELPGGNAAKAESYPGAYIYGEKRDHRVITVEPVDVNHDGKLDLLVHIEGMTATPILYNTGSAFSWTVPQS